MVADDPVAIFRWNVLRAVFRAMNFFRSVAVRRTRPRRAESLDRLFVPNETLSTSSRRGSDTTLNAFLRGELSADVVPEVRTRKQRRAPTAAICSSATSRYSRRSSRARAVNLASSIAKSVNRSSACFRRSKSSQAANRSAASRRA